VGPHHPAAPRPERLHLAQLADRRPRQAIPDRLRPRLTCTHFPINDLDGASAFGPATTATVSPATYADRLGAELATAVAASPDTPQAAVLATAISATANALDLPDDQGPSSTVTIARLSGAEVHLLALGDSYIACRSAGATTILTDDRIDRLNLPQASGYRERLAAGSGYDATHTATLQELQSGQRARRNTAGGYWIASADPRAAAHAFTATLSKETLEWIVLATDGAIETARHLGLDDWDAIARSDQAGLSALLQRCHEWAQNADPTAANSRVPNDTTTRQSRPSTWPDPRSPSSRLGRSHDRVPFGPPIVARRRHRVPLWALYDQNGTQ
jgi:serine/threonine protein phosphatase PrpC